uniref:Neuropilin and tolloid-like protein 1 n=1 Tax=Oncorhynchus tshawytscha TaxID=74940 RepID=A0A8C8IPP2_ONCTS
PVTNNSGVTAIGQFGIWIKEAEGGLFTSPNYPPEQMCIYIIEVRDGHFPFSTLIGRYCSQESPLYIKSSGRYLHIKFVVDRELENDYTIGLLLCALFSDIEFKDMGALPPLPFSEFDLRGSDGIIDCTSILKEGKALQTEAVDCRWFIGAPPKGKVKYEMRNSNECKHNVSCQSGQRCNVGDLGGGHTNVGSRESCFWILFTTFLKREAFFCHSNICINTSLLCNGIKNCVYPWYENNCKEKRKASILDNLGHTNVTIIIVTCGLVVVLLIVASIIQVKQPCKKYIIRRDDFEVSSVRGSQSNLNVPTTTDSRRNILMMRHSYSKGGQDGCDQGDNVDDCPTTSHHVLNMHAPQPQK